MWLENSVAADLSFWEDILRQEMYDKDIISFLRDSCLKVEDNVMQWLKEEEERKARRLFGCEISVVITVKQEQRTAVAGLHDLSSDDVAIFLLNQLCDPMSTLNSMKMTKDIVDISFTPMYATKGPFDSWMSYWIHIIHPSFLTYTTRTYSGKEDRDENSDALTLYTKTLAPGLKIVNPIETFDDRTRQAYQALGRKPLLMPPGYRKKRTDDLEENEAVEIASGTQTASLIDLGGDEFGAAAKGKKMQLFRPNMERLAPRDLERLQRVYKACKHIYETEMLPGLINNAMRPTQFEALKNLEASFRIYRTAKQRFERSLRKAAADGGSLASDAVIPLKITNIEQTQYDQWLDEVKAEDRQRLREHRENAAKVREELKHEAKLRREAERTKILMMEGFISNYKEHQPHEDHEGNEILSEVSSTFASAYPGMQELYDHYYNYVHDALELDHAVRKELDQPLTMESLMENLEEVNPLPVVQEIIALTNTQAASPTNGSAYKDDSPLDVIVEKKKLRISEEKKTRRLFAMMQTVDVFIEAEGMCRLVRSSNINLLQIETVTGGQEAAEMVIDALLDSVFKIKKSNKEGEVEFKEDSLVEKEKALKFIDFVSSVLYQMDTLKHNLQYAAFLKDNPSVQNNRRTHRRKRAQNAVSISASDTPNTLRPLTSPTKQRNPFFGSSVPSTPHARSNAQSSAFFPPSSPSHAALVPPTPHTPHTPHSPHKPQTPHTTRNGLLTSRTQTNLSLEPVFDEEEESVQMTEEDAEDLFYSVTINNYNLLSREEWQFLKELRWLKAVREHPPFFDCLKNYKTLKDSHYLKDELVQVSKENYYYALKKLLLCT